MNLYNGTQARHGNTPYNHYNNSLLFQFILSDFIRAFESIQLLDSISNRNPMSSPESAYHKNNQEIPNRIEAILIQLVGSKNEAKRAIPWSSNEGTLSKMKALCNLFLQNSDNDEKELIALQHYVDKAWHHCSQGYEALRGNQNKRFSLSGALEKASHAMHRFAKLIARVALQFHDDENVIYFFLRHKEHFDKLYGKRFMNKLLSRMYPKGLREAEYFLTKKYLERNFDNIPSQIVSKIAELEASSL